MQQNSSPNRLDNIQKEKDPKLIRQQRNKQDKCLDSGLKIGMTCQVRYFNFISDEKDTPIEQNHMIQDFYVEEIFLQNRAIYPIDR